MAGKNYSHQFNDLVNGKLPSEVVEALDKHGWNALGIYEVVAETRKKARQKLIPVFAYEEHEGNTEQPLRFDTSKADSQNRATD